MVERLKINHFYGAPTALRLLIGLDFTISFLHRILYRIFYCVIEYLPLCIYYIYCEGTEMDL